MSLTDNDDTSIPDTSSLNLGLGDIIKLIASNNEEINDKIFYISYIDSNKIVLINNEKTFILNIDENKELTEKSIESIEILSKAENKGYAKQNGLIINTWISIQFDGELPLTINGIITDQENDLIEVKTYPDEEYIYIDFAYKGIPEDLPIKSITKIDSPIEDKNKLSTIDDEETLLIDDSDIQSNLINKNNFEKELQNIVIPNDLIEFGEELDEIKVLVDVEKSEQRFDIEQQLNDLLDEMLSIIPNSERTSIKLNNIHKQIDRFNQLRDIFSEVDSANNYNLKKSINKDYKPIIEEITKFEKNIKWITPVIANKKIFFEDEQDIPEDDSLYIVRNTFDDIDNYYEELEKIKSNSNIDSINKYRLILQNINVFNTTFLNENNSYFYKTNINKYINFLVNNYDNIMSNTLNYEYFKPYSFYNQVLNSPDTNLERIIENNKKKYNRIYHTYDEALLNSFVVNNEILYKFSNMDLHNSSIYQKSNYSFFNKYFISHNNFYKKNYNQQIIDNFSVNFNFNNVLKNNYHFSPNLELFDNNSDKSNISNLESFLNSILPTTDSLIDKFKDSKLNITEFLYILQPNYSNIYNIEFQLYTKIINYIKVNIEEYKKSLTLNKNNLESIINKTNKNIIDLYKNTSKNNIYTTIFQKLNSNLKTNFFNYYDIKNYKINDDNSLTSDSKKSSNKNSNSIFTNENKYLYTDEEVFNNTNNIDFNKTFFYSFYQNLLELITSNQIEQFLDVKNKNLSDLKQEASDTCKKFVLSKKYLEIDELESDNNKIIYFDKKLDRTNYSLLEKLKEKRKSMTQDDFNLLLKNKLLEENLIDETNIEREIDSLLKGKREVIEGDYALLLTNDKEKTLSINNDNKSNDKVYIRQNNKWILDKNVDPNMFFVSNKLFCNLQEKCVETNNNCNTFEEYEKKTENEDIKNIIENSAGNFKLNIEETKEKINKELNDAILFLERKNKYSKILYLKYNENLLKIGQTFVENEFELSPYENLKNKILGYKDFVKRQDYLIKFCNLFTREAINDEDKNWLYCNKTNKKLIPSFFKLLANSYYNGDYVYVLDEIIAERGTISDDGNSWVDKYSGYTIKMIEFDSEEGYNEEGFKLQTRDVLEKEYVINETNIKYTSETSKTIYKVIVSISNFIGLNLESFHDFIINNAVELLKLTIPSQDIYEQKRKKAREQGKKELTDYNTLYNSTLIVATMVYIIVAIQTSIPSLKSKKTFPGCIKSFSGYPLFGNVDKSSITYIACVVNNIKTNISPWNSILKTSQNSLIKKMENIIENNVLNNKKILDLFDKKNEYLKYNKDDIIPDILDLNRWVTFLPPLYEIKMSDEKLQPVAQEFENVLFDNIRKGKTNDYKYDILFKINNLAFGFIKSIQNSVKKFTTLLSTNNGEPFLENACCNEFINTIDFFKQEDSKLNLYNNNSYLLEKFIININKLETAPILFHPFNTKVKSYIILNTFSEKIIYEYFIKKCKFDSILPIPDNLRAICLNKPSDYNSYDTIEKKIQILKNNGNNYSIESLEELMQIINYKNSFKLENKENIDSIQKLYNTLKSINELIDQDESIEKLFNKKIIEKFLEILDKSPGIINKNITNENDNEIIREFKNLLIKDTELNKNRIFEYVSRNANINKKEFDKFKECLENFFNFNDTNFENLQQFFKNSLRNVIRVFPNIVINNNNIQESNFIPNHWKLSSKHNEDLYKIANKYYKPLIEFFDSKKLDLILKYFQDKCLLIEKLVANTNFYKPIKLEKSSLTIFTIFDEKLTLLLFENYLYKILTYLPDLYHEPKLILELNEIDNDNNYNNSSLSNDDNLNKSDYQIEGGVSQGILDSENNGVIEYSSFVDEEKSVIENSSANIIYSFINILCDTKSLINISYSSINKKISYAKDKEKTTIVNFLKELTPEEREIEDLLKNSKLERWSVGLQKGLTQYDPQFYDKEREKLEEQLLQEVKLQNVDDVTRQNAEIFNYDLEYQAQVDKDVEKEYNLSNIPDDNDNDFDDFEDTDYLNYDGEDGIFEE